MISVIDRTWCKGASKRRPITQIQLQKISRLREKKSESLKEDLRYKIFRIFLFNCTYLSQFLNMTLHQQVEMPGYESLIDYSIYLDAIKAAQVQFSVHLLTPALNSFIRKFHDKSDMDFADCCKFMLDFSRTQGMDGKLFKKLLYIRHRVAHQKPLGPESIGCDPIKLLQLLAVFLDRQDLKKKILCFVAIVKPPVVQTRAQLALTNRNLTLSNPIKCKSMEYLEATRAAQVQFAINLLTSELRFFIGNYFIDDEVDDDIDFKACCEYMIKNCFWMPKSVEKNFEMALRQKNQVAHQNRKFILPGNPDPIYYFKLLVQSLEIKHIDVSRFDFSPPAISVHALFFHSYINSTLPTPILYRNVNTYRDRNLCVVLLENLSRVFFHFFCFCLAAMLLLVRLAIFVCVMDCIVLIVCQYWFFFISLAIFMFVCVSLMCAFSAFLISFFILLVAVCFVVKLIYEGLNLFVCLLKCTVLLLCECWPLFSLAGLMYAIS